MTPSETAGECPFADNIFNVGAYEASVHDAELHDELAKLRGELDEYRGFIQDIADDKYDDDWYEAAKHARRVLEASSKSARESAGVGTRRTQSETRREPATGSTQDPPASRSPALKRADNPTGSEEPKGRGM